MRSVSEILQECKDVIKNSGASIDQRRSRLINEIDIITRDELKISIGERDMIEMLCAVGSVEQAIEFAALRESIGMTLDDEQDRIYWHNVAAGLRRVSRNVSG